MDLFGREKQNRFYGWTGAGRAGQPREIRTEAIRWEGGGKMGSERRDEGRDSRN